MKKIYLYLLIIMLTGCQKIPTIFSKNPSQQISTDSTQANLNCPENPGDLSPNNVTKINNLSNVSQTLKSKVNKNQTIGYTFTLSKGARLSYNLDNNKDFCVWIITPGNQLVKTSTLQAEYEGEYLMQIEALRNQDFKMDLGLSYPSPVEFVRNYYQLLNSRQYQTTWTYLTPKFQKIAPTYTDYTEWWDSVAEIRIGDITLIDDAETENAAIVNIELAYKKESGRLVKDNQSRVYLIWNQNLKTWQINEKKSPPDNTVYSFNPDNYPQGSCGDSKPRDPNDYPVDFYPVNVSLDNLSESEQDELLQRIQNRYCRDAFFKKSKDNGEKVIQVASFTRKKKAETFANFMNINKNTWVGSPTTVYD